MDFVGLYSPEDVVEAFSRAFAEPDFPQRALFLMDMRFSDSVGSRPVPNIRELADRMAPLAAERGERFAVVVAEPVQFGVIRMASVFAESHGIEVRLFEDLPTATAWLGSSPSEDAGAGGSPRPVDPLPRTGQG
jgi:hypothetical protein